MYGFTYTTHGAMTAADLAEIRADYDLDLCACCEAGPVTLAALAAELGTDARTVHAFGNLEGAFWQPYSIVSVEDAHAIREAWGRNV